jgi:serine protease Do
MTAVGLALAAIGVVGWFVAAPAAGGQDVRVRPLQDSRSQLFGQGGIGVTIQDVEPADVTRLKLPTAAGALVTAVRPGGPAERAGIKVGDVIVMFDGQAVRSVKQFSRMVDETPSGREANAMVMRDGARVDLKVTPVASDSWTAFSSTGPLQHFQFSGPQPFTFAQPFFRDHFDALGTGGSGRLGVEVQELTGQLGDYFGAKEGVLVTSVDEGTPAKTAGLKVGDVITKFNAFRVLSVDELRRRVTGATGEVTLTIVRDKKEQTLTVKLDGTAPRTIIR